MVFDAISLVLIVVLALVFWTIGRKYEGLRTRAPRQLGFSACLHAIADSGPLAPGADPETPEATHAPAVIAGDVTEDLTKNLRRVAAMDGSFDADRFLEGARLVYEAIVLAFAKGDRELLTDLLTADVSRTFLHSIALREARLHRVSLRFVRLNGARIEAAAVVDGQARIVVAFDSEIITATRDAANAIVDGDPATVVAVADRWTFVKTVRSSGVWKLAATESPGGASDDDRITEAAAISG